ncbi:MAG: putative GNAT family acetyltransferase [Vicingaceae bacterium]|jgi:predicted GNAT family acetyltransferase
MRSYSFDVLLFRCNFTAMKIEIEQNETKGAANFSENGIRLAEMTYSIASSELIIIDHTAVDDSLKGQEVGKKLLFAIVKRARKENFKILPLCPFAKAVFFKNESIKDVLR